jgi:hypothetical protein
VSLLVGQTVILVLVSVVEMSRDVPPSSIGHPSDRPLDSRRREVGREVGSDGAECSSAVASCVVCIARKWPIHALHRIVYLRR